MWPFLVSIEGFTLPSYFVINSLAFSIGVVWIFKRAQQFKMDQNSVLDIALAGMLGGFIGARLAHILFEQPRFYWEHLDFIYKFSKQDKVRLNFSTFS